MELDQKKLITGIRNKILVYIIMVCNTVESEVWIINASTALGRKQSHADSLGRKPFFEDGNPCRKQEIADSLGGSQI